MFAFKSIQLNMKQQNWRLLISGTTYNRLFGITSFKQFLESPDEKVQRFRLAIRMSFTITLSFILMWSVGGIKIIWIPMNVFLLLHPVKAEMNTRIKTRFWGLFWMFPQSVCCQLASIAIDTRCF